MRPSHSCSSPSSSPSSAPLEPSGTGGSFVDDPPIGIEGAVIPPGKGLKSALGLKEVGTTRTHLCSCRLQQLPFHLSDSPWPAGRGDSDRRRLTSWGFHAGPLFGFTKANEMFGIAFSIIGEIITGKEALAQLNIETGVPISDIEPLVLFSVAFFFIAALNPGTGKFVTDV
ncbi:hypothetical protein Taro_026747 [Colocasia esculenta]|uniref:Uncharacterized protein n=1 Tax=Colocasia esculenta TaxID=4460 RepID=A0A843VS85_COLES|nr:hypothetical protein [Colocasia esculenta]